MKNYYIIHGFMGSNIENWFPWFKEQIDSDNSLCVIPQFPIGLDKHNYNNGFIINHIKLFIIYI